MLYNKVKRLLAITLISTMVCGLTVGAAEPTNQTPDEGSRTVIEESVSESTDTTEDIVEDVTQGTEDVTQPEVTDETLNQTEQPGNLTDQPTDNQDIEESVTGEGLVTALPDEETQALLDEYAAMNRRRGVAGARVGSYESELANFPASYRAYLEAMHQKYPNWIFVAVDTGLDWNTVVTEESKSGSSSQSRSLISVTSGDLLLSKASTDYDVSTGEYIGKDGSSWVSASRAAVANYVDPRNYLTEEYIYAMEALDYNSAHTLEGVENILKGTELSNKKISYINTSGATVNLDYTYGEIILSAGIKSGISPLFLAAKIKQETAGKLTNGSISGNYTDYFRGYYNFYNIGANASAEGNAIANGLTYAMKSGTYSRPWTSPVKAIQGGADFFVESYIARGQNTTYFQKFNVVDTPYFGHQYMQNLTAAATEGKSTYSSYKANNILDNQYVFYIPVYENMPEQNSDVAITKSVKTGTTSSGVNMRTAPSTSSGIMMTIPKGSTVTVEDGMFTTDTSVYLQLAHPYWYKVTYNNTTGYISSYYLNMNVDSTINAGSTKQLSVGVAAGETIYYETSDPAIATVDANGVVKGVKAGTCTIYAISSSGKQMDAIGIKVTGTASGNTTTGKTYTIYETTTRVNYRTGPGTSYSISGTFVSGKKISVENGYSQSANGYTWYRLTLNNKEYYVASNYLKKTGSSEPTITPAVTVATPTLVSAVNNNGSVTVTWKAATNATGYYVYRKESGGSWSKIGTVYSKDVVTYKDSTVKSGVSYSYTVCGYNGSVVGSYNNSGVSTYYLSTPSLKSTSASTSAITVNWNAVSGADGYYVYRKTSGGSWSHIGTASGQSTASYTDKTAVAETTYYYTVRAYKGSYLSEYVSAGVSGKIVIPKTYTNYKTTTRVNFRTGPGTSYSKGGTFAAGKVISVEDGYSKVANGYTWYRFKENNTEYYVASNYVTKVTTSTGSTSTSQKTYTTYKTTTRVNYRTGPGTSYGTSGTLAKSVDISVENGYSKSANGYVWYRFKLNNKEYYVASNYLAKVHGTANNDTSQKTYTVYKTTTGVNYRTGPGTGYSKGGAFSAGKQVAIENGYSINANGYTWYRFKLNNKEYYIASKYLKKQ